MYKYLLFHFFLCVYFLAEIFSSVINEGPFKGQKTIKIGNEKMEMVILPDLGGRIAILRDKKTGIDIINALNHRSSEKYGQYEKFQNFSKVKWDCQPLKNINGIKMVCSNGRLQINKVIKFLSETRTLEIAITYTNIGTDTLNTRFSSLLQYTLERGDDYWSDEFGQFNPENKFIFQQVPTPNTFDRTKRNSAIINRKGNGALIFSPLTPYSYDYLLCHWKFGYSHLAIRSEKFNLASNQSRSLKYRYTYIPDSKAIEQVSSGHLACSKQEHKILMRTLKKEFKISDSYRSRLPDLDPNLGLDKVGTAKPLCRVAVINQPIFTASGYKSHHYQTIRNESWLVNHMSVEVINKLNQLDAVIIIGRLTAKGKQEDLNEMIRILSPVKVPIYIVPSRYKYEQNFSEKIKGEMNNLHFMLRDSVEINNIKLVFGGGLGDNSFAPFVTFLNTELRSDKKTSGILVFEGQLPSKKDLNSPLLKSIKKHKIAAFVKAEGSIRTDLIGELPLWVAPYKVWNHQENWLMGIISCYENHIELGRLNMSAQPMQNLIVPNPHKMKYMKSVTEDPVGVPSYSFHRSLKPKLTFVQLSDPQIDDFTEPKRAGKYKSAVAMNIQAVDEVNRLSPSMVFMTGDLVNKNTPKEWKMFHDIYDNLKRPLYPLIGNHDILPDLSTKDKRIAQGDLLSIQQANWKFVKTNIEPKGYKGPHSMYLSEVSKYLPGKSPSYTIRKNDCAFIMINTNIGWIEKSELEWLEEELKKTIDAKHVIVLGHYPVLNIIGHNVPLEKGGKKALELFKKYKVAAYLSGHRHKYAYKFHNGTAHIIADCLCWGKSLSYQIYHVFDHQIISCWKPLNLNKQNPLYECVIIPEPRYKAN